MLENKTDSIASFNTVETKGEKDRASAFKFRKTELKP